MPKKQPLYPHVPKGRKKTGTRAFKCEQCGYAAWNVSECPKCGSNKLREMTFEETEKEVVHRQAAYEGPPQTAPQGSRRFPLGQMVMTRGVADKVAEDTEFAKFVMVSIARHATGDWGDMVKEDKAENELALREGNLRLFSAYEHPRLPKIWIITEADRSVTTVLFPEEY